MLTPIVFFTFNRPDFTKKTLAKIIEASPQKIYLVQDGPRPRNSQDRQLVSTVRAEFRLIPENIETIEIFSTKNMGIKNRFFSALDEIFEIESSAIIVEDDCLLDKSFFFFAQSCLQEYKHDQRVGLISAHRPTNSFRKSTVYFDEFPRIWGWATWDRAWSNFKHSRRQNHHLPHYLGLALKKIRSTTVKVMAKQLFTPDNFDSNWDVQFASHLLVNNLMSVTPPKNAVDNLGAEKGTHRQDWAFIELPHPETVSSSLRMPPASVRTIFDVAIEDSIRFTRWALALIRSPKRGLSKLLSMKRAP